MKKKLNIIVFGFRHTPDDLTAFSDFVVSELSLQPHIVSGKRLGKGGKGKV